MADGSSRHAAALQSHLFPSFSALNIHADTAGGASRRRRHAGGKRSRMERTKVRAHRLRSKLHEWEDRLEHEAHLRPASLGLPRAMPDMRFEQSYLATVRGFVHELRPDERDDEKRAVLESRAQEHAGDAEKRAAQAADADQLPAVVATVTRTPEPELWLGNLKIDWYPLLWVTVRDQVVSPLIQGTIWGLAGLAFAQLRTVVAEQRRVSRQGGPLAGQGSVRRAEKAGPGVSLLRALGLGRKA